MKLKWPGPVAHMDTTRYVPIYYSAHLTLKSFICIKKLHTGLMNLEDKEVTQNDHKSFKF